ncbi:MAG TPA: MarR family transcriptional regulator [Gaiellales bacterium]|jgi:DNA-binding MarR family transcriptional regulator|nr:MarR family transcriptional regulator [Gaiellales bacterium]
MGQKPSNGHCAGGLAEREPLGPPLIGALLRMPVDAVRRRMLERLHEHGFADIDPAHLTVVRYPGPQGQRPSDLAAQLGMSKQALNYQLGQLEVRGYLERRPDPEDQRSRRIVLTRRGVAAGHVIRDAVAELEAQWSRELGEKRYTQLRGLLVDLNHLL